MGSDRFTSGCGGDVSAAPERVGRGLTDTRSFGCACRQGFLLLLLHRYRRQSAVSRRTVATLEAARVVPSAEAADEVQAVGPAAVSRFVLHRLAALGAPATELARTVAVLGDDSEPTLAARVADVSVETTRRAGDELVRANIFVRAERFGFAHPIVRAALYEDLPPGERQALHAAAARALESDGASAVARNRAPAVDGAGGDRQRVETLRAAANSARHDRGSPQAAATRLRRALLEDPAEQERTEILTDLGRQEVAAMDFGGAEEHLREALDASHAALGTRAEAAVPGSDAVRSSRVVARGRQRPRH